MSGNTDIPKKNKPVVGYTSGVFDLFHVGHLNILKRAKSLCDRLIVGVTIDELVSYKDASAVVPFEERLEIVKTSSASTWPSHRTTWTSTRYGKS